MPRISLARLPYSLDYFRVSFSVRDFSLGHLVRSDLYRSGLFNLFRAFLCFSFSPLTGSLLSAEDTSARTRPLAEQLGPRIDQLFEGLQRGQTSLWNSASDEERHRFRHSFTLFTQDSSLDAGNPATFARNYGSSFRFFPEYKKDQQSLFDSDSDDKVVNTYHFPAVSDSPASRELQNGFS